MSNEQRNTIWRFALIFIAIALGFVAVIGRIVYVQTVERDKWLSVAVHQDPVYQPIPATRGNILDCHGNPLAITTPTYYMLMDMKADALIDHDGKLFWQNVDTLAHDLARVLGNKSQAEYKKILINGYKAKNRELYLANSVDYFQQKELAKNPLIKRGRYQSGVYYKPRNERILPYGMLASRTIGGIYAENGQGKSGLEKEFNDALSGTDGVCRVERIGGRPESITVRDAVDGLDVVTTIDAELQDIVEQAIIDKVQEKKAKWGCCILMETKTGYIRAIANVDRTGDSTFVEDLNHAVRRIEPGSTFKTVSLIAMMNDNLLKITDTVSTTEKPWYYHPIKNNKKKNGAFHRDSHKKDTVYTAHDALVISSNIAFAKYAVRCYNGSATKFINSLQKIGIRDEVYIEIPGYEKPLIRHPNDTVTMSKMAYGYAVEISPVTLAMFYNAIANNGRMMRPMLVTSIQQHGKNVKTFAPQVIKENFFDHTKLEQVKAALHDVVWDNNLGTASVRADKKTKKAQSDIVSLAGKTGTAQLINPATRKHDPAKHRMLFAGYFPDDNPQYTIVCVIEDPVGDYDAGTHSGTTARKIAEKVMAYTGCYVYKNGERKLEKR